MAKSVQQFDATAHRAAPKVATSATADLWAGFKLGVRRWARDTFSRTSLTNSLRSLVWVAPLTVLVWVYAERQELAREDRMTFTVDVVSRDSNYVVTVLDRDGRPIRDLLLVADLTGPRQGVENAKAELLRSVAKPAVQVTVDPPKDAGTISVPIVGQVESANVFQSNGVSLSNLSQGVVTVHVDPIREESVDVSPPDAIADRVIQFISEPRTVKVRGPASVLQRAAPLKVTPDVSNVAGISAPGEHRAQAPLVVANVSNENVSVLPQASATVTVRIRESDAAGKLTTGIPINLYIPPALSRLYDVTLVSGDSVANLQVEGPPNVIRALETDTHKPPPTATLRIDRLDTLPAKLDQDQVRAVELQLPKDVRFTGDPATLNTTFRVTRR